MRKQNTVAIIPARGGSQGIPDKNIRIFEGKPLIAWTIECALTAEGVDRVIVSTDSERIAAIARRYGAEVPFLRPASLAVSTTPIEPVMSHAYEWLKDEEKYQVDGLILLFPTNPLRNQKQVEEALNLYYKTQADCVISVNESPAHYTPYWTLVRDEQGAVSFFGGQDIRKGYSRRQDFPQKCFAKNDLIFVLRPENLFAQVPSLYGERVELYVTERIFDGDINTIEDWRITLQIFKMLNKKKVV